MSQTAQPPVPASYEDDEIDVRQLLATVWQQRKLIVSMGLLGGALGLGFSFYSAKYVSVGLFQTPSQTVSAASYKRYEGVLLSSRNLEQFLEKNGKVDDAAVRLLGPLTERPDGLREVLAPEFAFTDKDQKALGVKLAGDEAGALLGMRITFSHKQPTLGAPLNLLGEYVRDTVLRLDLERFVSEQCVKFQTRELELRNQQLASLFNIRQEENRSKTLRRIVAETPNGAAVDTRQVVSLDKGGERFLSPRAQLNASEIAIAEAKLAENQRERERVSSIIKRSYYCGAQKLLQGGASGRDFLQQAKKIHADALKGQDKTIEIVEQTANELDLQLDAWNSTYLQQMRFVVPPESVEIKQRKPGPVMGTGLGGLLGGLLGILIAFIFSWWQASRGKITNE